MIKRIDIYKKTEVTRKQVLLWTKKVEVQRSQTTMPKSFEIK